MLVDMRSAQSVWDGGAGRVTLPKDPSPRTTYLLVLPGTRSNSMSVWRTNNPSLARAERHALMLSVICSAANLLRLCARYKRPPATAIKMNKALPTAAPVAHNCKAIKLCVPLFSAPNAHYCLISASDSSDPLLLDTLSMNVRHSPMIAGREIALGPPV